MPRTYIGITPEDLEEIKQYALEELNRFLHECGSPAGKYKVYKGKLVAICLCQGVAAHFVDGKTGINDVDVWFFFQENEDVKIPNIKNMRYSKELKFERLGEKRIDFLKKAIRRNIFEVSKSSEPTDVLNAFLRSANTASSRELAKKPVIGLYPTSIFASIIWRPVAF